MQLFWAWGCFRSIQQIFGENVAATELIYTSFVAKHCLFAGNVAIYKALAKRPNIAKHLQFSYRAVF